MSKQWLGFEQQLELLQSRGMQIDDHQEDHHVQKCRGGSHIARHCIRPNIVYERFY